MATSGTVAQFRYTVQQTIDHAFRRATGLSAARLAGEGQIIARETLFTLLSEVVNVGWPLWTQQFKLLSVGLGSADVATPDGTVDIIHAYWRILQPWRGTASLSDGADGTNLFAGVPNDDITITGTSPYVEVNFTDQNTVDTIGVLLGGATPITAALAVVTSDDGVTFATAATLPLTIFTPGVWSYFPLDPTITAQYMRLQNTGATTWTLNQLNFARGSDIEIGLVSIDDYYNLPNKMFSSSQVVQGYIERNTLSPKLKAWPVPNQQGFYNGTISAVLRRYIQDPGAFADTLEIPKRWYEAVIWRLASRLVDELPDDATGLADYPPALRIQEKDRRAKRCDEQAARSEALSWAEEKTRGPIRISPDLSAYTR